MADVKNKKNKEVKNSEKVVRSYNIFYERKFACRINGISATRAINEFIRLRLPTQSKIDMDIAIAVKLNNNAIMEAKRTSGWNKPGKKGVFEVYYKGKLGDMVAGLSGKNVIDDCLENYFTDKIEIQEEVAYMVKLYSGAIISAVQVQKNENAKQ